MKAFYLMGCGQVFSVFIQEYEKTEDKARARLATVTSFDMNSTMKRVVSRFDDEKLVYVFSKFIFGIESGRGPLLCYVIVRWTV
jgi:hypothetical protein